MESLTIYCGLRPDVPNTMQLKEHFSVVESFKWNPQKVLLYLDVCQGDSTSITGDQLLKKLWHKRVLNANVIDFLLVHQHLIPEEWKDKRVFFWGTTYSRNGRILVPCIAWCYDKWERRYRQLRSYWFNDAPAAILE